MRLLGCIKINGVSIPRLVAAFTLWIFCGAFSHAELVVAKPYDYTETLDDSPRAKQKDSLYWQYVSAAEFAKLKKEFDPSSFDVWAGKLERVLPDMTLEGIAALLKPKKVCPMMTYGAGTVTIIELDNAYYVHGVFDPEGRLKTRLSHPIAINYGIRLVHHTHEQER